MTIPQITELNRVFVPLSVEVGRLIMDFYNSGFEVEFKADDSPVTAADQAAEREIVNSLETHWPLIPIVAEEMCAAGIMPEASEIFFLVDALDGTKEFVQKRDEFTINIALIAGGTPYYGLVYTPARGELFICLDEKMAGYCLVPPEVRDNGHAQFVFEADKFEKISVRDWPVTGPVAAVSRSHMDEDTTRFLKQNNVDESCTAGSSLKFCLLARGQADLYPRFSPTMEWDTAAGHAVLLAAGGELLDMEGAPFLYGKFEQGYRNGGFFAAQKDRLKDITLL